jgi:flagellar biosynthetic protein FliR
MAELSIDQAWLVALLLGLARAAGFIAICPPFSSSAIPGRVKAIIAVSFALASAGTQAVPVNLKGEAQFLGAVATQAALGLALGFGVYVLFAAIGAAGDLIDLSIGFSSAQALDPVTGVQSSVVTRLFNYTATALLFSTGGHILLVRGFVRAGASVQTFSLSHLGQSALAASAQLFVAAIEIALPVAGSLLVAEIALAMLGKAAPQLNVFQLGFAVKIVVGVTLLGLSVTLLPEQVSSLVGHGLDYMAGVK